MFISTMKPNAFIVRLLASCWGGFEQGRY